MAVTHSLDLERSSSQYATVPDAADIDFGTGDFTVEGWIKLESIGIYQGIVSKIDASDFDGFQFVIQNNNTLYFHCADNASVNGNILNPTTYTLTSGVWYHVAAVRDATTIYIYVNGELIGSMARNAYNVTNTETLALGLYRSADTTANYFDGMMRNFRVWNDARTQAEIRANMNIDTPADTTGLVRSWILNNAYTDAMGNADLTASGSPTFATVYPDALDLTENGTYLKKHKITIDNTKVSGSADLTDVPIVLTESNFLADAFSNSLNGGADIRFSTDIDGKVRLAHEIVTWNTGTSVAEVHVKVNTLSYNADTDIYVHYNNSSAVAIDENEAFGKHQVWGDNWRGVWHLGETSGTRMDSSKNSNDLTDNNTVASSVGKIGTGADFESSNSEYLSRTHASQTGLEITGSQTWMIWLKPESRLDSRIMDKNTNARGFIDFLPTNGYYFYMGGLTTNTNVQSSVTPTIGQWHLLTGVYDSSASKLKIFYNTTKTEVTASGTVSSSTSNFTIGSLNNGASNYWDGLADEARIYNGALSDDYITTLYNNQNSPSTFATASAVGNASAFFMFL